MKIKIPYVVVMAERERTVFDVCFIDTVSKESCVALCRSSDLKPLSSRVGHYEADRPYTEVNCEDLFCEVCAESACNYAWDDIQSKVIEVARSEV